jgi:hypothetical protein
MNDQCSMLLWWQSSFHVYAAVKHLYTPYVYIFIQLTQDGEILCMDCKMLWTARSVADSYKRLVCIQINQVEFGKYNIFQHHIMSMIYIYSDLVQMSDALFSCCRWASLAWCYVRFSLESSFIGVQLHQKYLLPEGWICWCFRLRSCGLDCSGFPMHGIPLASRGGSFTNELFS